jgi:hypothetical protein
MPHRVGQVLGNPHRFFGVYLGIRDTVWQEGCLRARALAQVNLDSLAKEPPCEGNGRSLTGGPLFDLFRIDLGVCSEESYVTPSKILIPRYFGNHFNTSLVALRRKLYWPYENIPSWE